MNISKKNLIMCCILDKICHFCSHKSCIDYICSFSKFWLFFQCLCVCIIKTYKNLAISLPSNLTAWKWHYLSMRIIKYMYNYELVSTVYIRVNKLHGSYISIITVKTANNSFFLHTINSTGKKNMAIH